MKSRSFFLVIAISLLLSACFSEEKNKVRWPHGVKYEVFVMSFADGDGDGKGDFKGLTARLDYLKDLGINGIWLMPVMPSDTYHKYHVIDYKNIDPDYGTLDDFKKFVKICSLVFKQRFVTWDNFSFKDPQRHIHKR